MEYDCNPHQYIITDVTIHWNYGKLTSTYVIYSDVNNKCDFMIHCLSKKNRITLFKAV